MITITNLSFSFNNLEIFNNLSLTLKRNEFYCVLGPSGCGKSTLLNIIAGIIDLKSDNVQVDRNGNIGYLFQEDLLLPWRTLKENIELGLDVLKLESNETNKYIKSFDLKGYEKYYPNELSGGMKQRAALIRTILPKPNILLLDEPFSNLDFDIKLRIQKDLLYYQQETNCLIIMVTHDIEDAIALSDKVIVLTEKPTTVKKIIDIDTRIKKKDPIEARKSPEFSNYFKEIWNELKYNNVDVL
jgi:NitT/TauT family transport system ATP-binding protein